MKANGKFTMRITPEDRKVFAELARLYKRSSQSDALRYIAHEAVRVFKELAEGEAKPKAGSKLKTAH